MEGKKERKKERKKKRTRKEKKRYPSDKAYSKLRSVEG
jgi:hypothetical protein